MITVTAIAILSVSEGRLPRRRTRRRRSPTAQELTPSTCWFQRARRVRSRPSRRWPGSGWRREELPREGGSGAGVGEDPPDRQDIEVKALEARVKEAKATGDKAELESLKAQINAQRATRRSPEHLWLCGTWDELAGALERAGNEWLEFSRPRMRFCPAAGGPEPRAGQEGRLADGRPADPGRLQAAQEARPGVSGVWSGPREPRQGLQEARRVEREVLAAWKTATSPSRRRV